MYSGFTSLLGVDGPEQQVFQMSTTKGAALLGVFTFAVKDAVDEHIRAGRVTPIYAEGVLVAVKLKASSRSLYGEMRVPKKSIWRFWRS